MTRKFKLHLINILRIGLLKVKIILSPNLLPKHCGVCARTRSFSLHYYRSAPSLSNSRNFVTSSNFDLKFHWEISKTINYKKSNRFFGHAKAESPLKKPWESANAESQHCEPPAWNFPNFVYFSNFDSKFCSSIPKTINRGRMQEKESIFSVTAK